MKHPLNDPPRFHADTTGNQPTKAWTRDVQYLAKMMKPIEGYRFVRVEQGEDKDGGEFAIEPYALLVFSNGKATVKVAVMCDEEGNGPGWLSPDSFEGPKAVVEYLDRSMS